MTIQEYQTERRKSTIYRDTVSRHLRDTFSTIEDRVRDANGRIDFSKLADDAIYQAAIQGFNDNIRESMYSFMNSTPINDGGVVESRLMRGYLGASISEIGGLMDKLRPNMDFGSFNANMMQYVGAVAEEVKNDTAVGKLTPADVNEILTYTGTRGRVDPNKLAANPIARAALVDAYDFGQGNVSDDIISRLKLNP